MQVTISTLNLVYFFRLIRESTRQCNRKQQLREGMKKVCPKSTEATSVLKNFNRCQQGRPRIEVDQPENLSTIFKIV